MSGHRVELTLPPRWGIESQVVCDEPDTAPCRTYCPRPECEDGCTDEVLPVAEHRKVPTRTCNVKDWLESDDIVSFYTGPPVSPIPNGPIEVTWGGDGYGNNGYRWTYAQPEGGQA